VSSSLDYAYNDWCIAQAAKVLGHQDDHDFLLARSQSYAKLWDASVGFFRPKNPDGTWFGDFDEFAWSAGYVEGGAWQCTWAVPHDPDGLAELMGGRQAMLAKLDRMLGLPPIFHVGEYGQVIHEMTEMANANFGQYAHSNQPVHHVLCFFAALGEPWKTEYWTRRVCQDLYDSTPDGFAGDEDNGEMACWYLLSAIGLFPLCVGDPNYTLTSPSFDRVTVQLPENKTLVVRAENQGEHNHYVQSRTLNGQPLNGTTIPHALVMQGGEMVVTLGPQPPDRSE
jgi:predicted alpha-1,2-mannosidase